MAQGSSTSTQLSLVPQITSRDGTLAMDSKVVNMNVGQKRPGLAFSEAGLSLVSGLLCDPGAGGVIGIGSSGTSGTVIGAPESWTSEYISGTYGISVAFSGSWGYILIDLTGGATLYYATSPTGAPGTWTAYSIALPIAAVSPSIGTAMNGDTVCLLIPTTTSTTLLAATFNGSAWTFNENLLTVGVIYCRSSAGASNIYSLNSLGTANALMAAVANSGYTYSLTTTDGLTWTLLATIANTVPISTFYLPETQLFYIFYPTEMTTSSDGSSWKIFVSYSYSGAPTTGILYSIAFSSGKFVGLGTSISNLSFSPVGTSLDGMNWVIQSEQLFTPPNVNFSSLLVVAEAGFFWLLGSAAPAALIYYSVDGKDWAYQEIPVAAGSSISGLFNLHFNPTTEVFVAGGAYDIAISSGFAVKAINIPTLNIALPSYTSSDCISGISLVQNGAYLTEVSLSGTPSITSITSDLIGATITASGSGGTAGTYPLGISGGSGTGGSGTYTINSSGNLASISISGGTGYDITPPTLSFPSGSLVGGSATALVNMYPSHTVPGAVTLDETTYVMDTSANIWGSNLNDITTWQALNYIVANSLPDTPIALSRILNYLVAFKSSSIEFFYDAGNPPPGSPLLPYTPAFLEIGCSTAGSIAFVNDTIFFLGTAQQAFGSSVYMMVGMQVGKVSDTFIDKIIANDPLTSVSAFILQSGGYRWYVLTLKTVGITLAYDIDKKYWAQWTTLTVNQPIAVSSININLTAATIVTTSPHGMLDGDPVLIAGSSIPQYNGRFNITYISSTSFSYQVPSGLGSPTGTVTFASYTKNTFNCGFAKNIKGTQYIQGLVDSSIYTLSPTTYDDNGCPIECEVVTDALQLPTSGTMVRIAAVQVIGDKVLNAIVPPTGVVSYSDWDYTNWSTYAPVNFALQQTRLLQQGATNKRAYKFRYTQPTPLRVNSLLLDMFQRTV